MTSITTTCHECGDVSGPLEDLDIKLRLETSLTPASYSFVCPSCLHRVERRASSHRLVDVLTALHVRIVEEPTDDDMAVAVDLFLEDLGLVT